MASPRQTVSLYLTGQFSRCNPTRAIVLPPAMAKHGVHVGRRRTKDLAGQVSVLRQRLSAMLEEQAQLKAASAWTIRQNTKEQRRLDKANNLLRARIDKLHVDELTAEQMEPRSHLTGKLVCV